MAPFTSLIRVFSNTPQFESSCFLDIFRRFSFKLTYFDSLSIDKASAINSPTLVCHGTNDYIVSLAHGEEIAAEIPGAELFVVEKATHQSLLCQRIMWDKIHQFLQKKLDTVKLWEQLVRKRRPPDTLSASTVKISNDSY